MKQQCVNLCALTVFVGTCSTLQNPLNGVVVFGNQVIGSIARYVCNDGFQLSGDRLRICQSGGVWSGNEPQCTRGV